MYVSKQRKKNKRIRFVKEVENSNQEERTARGFAARKDRKEQRRRLKMADKQRNEEIAMAFEIIKTANVSRIMSAGEAKSAYQKLLSDFLTAMGVPDMTDTQERLKFFQSNYMTATSEILEKDEERQLAKSYLSGICINRDYKNTFTNVLSLTSSEDSADRPPVLLAGTVDALPQTIGDALSQKMKAHIAKPFSDRKKRARTERNAVSSEVKKQKMEGQAEEDEKEEE